MWKKQSLWCVDISESYWQNWFTLTNKHNYTHRIFHFDHIVSNNCEFFRFFSPQLDTTSTYRGHWIYHSASFSALHLWVDKLPVTSRTAQQLTKLSPATWPCHIYPLQMVFYYYSQSDWDHRYMLTLPYLGTMKGQRRNSLTMER